MRVAAVIPTLNEAERIEECLRSLLRQTHPLHEIIVVDSGSTDGTAAIAQDVLSGFRNHTILLDQPLGIGLARQAGMEAAESEFILSLDADCVYPDDWLQRAMIHFDDPDVVCVMGVVTTESMDFIPRMWALREKLHVLGRGYAMLFRKLPGLRYDFEHVGEDQDIWAKLWKRGKVVTDNTLEVLGRLPSHYDPVAQGLYAFEKLVNGHAEVWGRIAEGMREPRRSP